MTPTTEHERKVLAALFAGTNMGLTPPDRDYIQIILKTEAYDLEQVTFMFWSHYMETPLMEEVIFKEANGWRKQKLFSTREEVQTVCPHNAKLIW